MPDLSSESVEATAASPADETSAWPNSPGASGGPLPASPVPVQGVPRFAPRKAPAAAPAEQCEFCAVALGPQHRHLLELATRKILCVCDACGLRFENVIGRWKLIPRSARALPQFAMADAQWEGLSLPINLAFFFRCAAAGKWVAMYPSPAGVMESLLPLESWQEVLAANPCLAGFEADVEALLANRLTPGAYVYYRAPMDVCYELAGLIRLHWRGLAGGDKVWRELEAFFERLKEARRA